MTGSWSGRRPPDRLHLKESMTVLWYLVIAFAGGFLGLSLALTLGSLYMPLGAALGGALGALSGLALAIAWVTHDLNRQDPQAGTRIPATFPPLARWLSRQPGSPPVGQIPAAAREVDVQQQAKMQVLFR